MFRVPNKLFNSVFLKTLQTFGGYNTNTVCDKQDTQFNPVSHILFDCDGLLLDTEKLYFDVNQSICTLYDKCYTWELGESVMGKTGVDAAKLIITTLNLPLTVDEYIAEARKKHEILFPDAELKPDSEKCYEKMYHKIANKFNKVYSWEVKMKLMGMTALDSARVMIRELNLPVTPEEFLKIQHTIEQSLMPHVTLLPGAEKLLTHLSNHNIPFAMATSSSLESLKLKSTNHEKLFSLFHHIVSGSSDPEVTHGKPAPDIYLICASRFPDKPKPEKCLVFEDAPNGVAAGRKAGMQVVMVPDPRVSEEKRSDATLVLSSLDEFKPELFGLPPFV